MSTERDIIEQAALWHFASERDDMDWDAFTRWLEADPAHARAFDEVALTDAAVVDIAGEDAGLVAANDSEGSAPGLLHGWRRWTGGAIAASLVAVLGISMLWQNPASVYRTQGERMTIALDDGSTIVLAPSSELTVDGSRQQEIALVGGAYFDIRHDPSRQLTVTAGPLSITDIGTEFDVQVTAEDVRVAVSEGTVHVVSDHLAQRLQLEAGRQLYFNANLGRSVASPVETAAVGGWRMGLLSYSDAALSLVSADLERYAGVELDVPDELGDRLFSGTLAIDDGNSAIRDLSQLMGLGLERVDGIYRLSEPAD